MMIDILPDRELDAEVAEKVFGGPHENVQWYWWKSSTPPIDIGPPLYAGPHFSTDIAAAWMVVDHLMQSRHIAVEFLRTADNEFVYCGFTEHQPTEDEDLWNDIGFAYEHTASLAVCRAALKAISQQ